MRPPNEAETRLHLAKLTARRKASIAFRSLLGSGVAGVAFQPIADVDAQSREVSFGLLEAVLHPDQIAAAGRPESAHIEQLLDSLRAPGRCSPCFAMTVASGLQLEQCVVNFGVIELTGNATQDAEVCRPRRKRSRESGRSQRPFELGRRHIRLQYLRDLSM